MIEKILNFICNELNCLVTVNGVTDYLFCRFISSPHIYSVYNTSFELEDIESVTIFSNNKFAEIKLKNKIISKTSCSDCDPVFMPMCDKCLGV